MRSAAHTVVMWERSDGLRCVAFEQRLKSARWEVRVVQLSRMVKQRGCRCFVAAMRIAHAWRTEFGVPRFSGRLSSP